MSGSEYERLTQFMKDLDAKYDAKWKSEHRFQYSVENLIKNSTVEEPKEDKDQ